MEGAKKLGELLKSIGVDYAQSSVLTIKAE
jgi:hypothetical protein